MSKQHSALAKEYNEKYQHEVILHGKDAAELRKLTKELVKKTEVTKETKRKLKQVELQLAEREAIWQEQNTRHAATVKENDERIADLVKQNNLLYSQVNMLTLHAAALKSQIAADNTTTTTASGAGSPTDGTDGSGAMSMEEISERNESDLRETVASLRKRNDMLELKVAAIEQERTRYQHQAEHAVSMRNELREKLRQAQEQQIAHPLLEAKHNELLQQVTQLNLLRESNVTLRAEKDKADTRVKVLEARVTKLKTQMRPLRLENSSLQAQTTAMEEEKKKLNGVIQTWRSKVDQLMTRYKRIDPEAHELLAKEKEELAKEKEVLLAEIASMKSSLASLSTTIRDNSKQLAAKDATISKLREPHRKLLLELTEVKAKYAAMENRQARMREVLAERESALKDLARKVEEQKIEADEAKADLQKVQGMLTRTRGWLASATDTLQKRAAAVAAEQEKVAASGDDAGEHNAGAEEPADDGNDDDDNADDDGDDGDDDDNAKPRDQQISAPFESVDDMLNYTPMGQSKKEDPPAGSAEENVGSVFGQKPSVQSIAAPTTGLKRKREDDSANDSAVQEQNQQQEDEDENTMGTEQQQPNQTTQSPEEFFAEVSSEATKGDDSEVAEPAAKRQRTLLPQDASVAMDTTEPVVSTPSTSTEVPVTTEPDNGNDTAGANTAPEISVAAPLQSDTTDPSEQQQDGDGEGEESTPVSYTHLTLPTNREV
eukprot:TRINITY_DN1563_c0_g1_i1.p1 TRINITY_DN1563_c0_g1~~TRINITY_DN1563_c0_g1_i1.p1  ORF type:complete len:719 (+),score=236.97 TRINITY_DN1563_c0_g1_i1:697-2853(+)